MSMENKLMYFLVDKGDQDGGIFLASAYEHLIDWQNKIIDLLIEKNKNNGLLNSFISQFDKEISIQDATESDIIHIDEKTYSYLEELIMNYSMRDIFTKEGKIAYKNYSENIYDYDNIELAKTIIHGKKKFKADQIKFIVYKFEEFRGTNSSIFIRFNEKYPKKDLSQEEKKSLDELLKNNDNNNFYFDISSSLQLIMNQLILDNYDPEKYLFEIINNLPHFIIINEELKELLGIGFGFDKKTFKINTLIPMYEYFENLCWKEMKKQISPAFKLELEEKDKESIIDYFEKNKNDEKKIINKKNFTTALRRLISRFLISSRQEEEIKPELNLSSYIGREELWSINILNNDIFLNEIFDICKNGIKVGMSYRLYEILGGDKILCNELGINLDELNQNGQNGGNEPGSDGQNLEDDDNIYDERKDEI